ncbi:translation initiation factor [Bdellovibrio sp. GT3]|uniref:translation initiation factor n=1 Tax=Bdellovibrio sp. GT3 TaxID=3136282 RepID=UPI0030F1FAD9
MKNTRLVYSTDPKDNVVCPQCKELKSDCKCRPEDDASQKFVVIFRLEKNGRGGKTVTVLDGLPRNEEFLKGFAKELKAKCGVGGSHSIGEKFGLVEIQGDKRDAVKKILQAKGISFKGM